MEAGEGRREMEEDLKLLYSTIFRFAASHQASAAMSNRAVDSPQGGAGYRAVVDMLRGAKWIRVPAPAGGDDLHFVTAAQLCFDLVAPHGDFFPPPESQCDDVPVDKQRSFLLNLGAVSAQQGGSLPPPLPADAASRQVSRNIDTTSCSCDRARLWPGGVMSHAEHQDDAARLCRACSCQSMNLVHME